MDMVKLSEKVESMATQLVEVDKRVFLLENLMTKLDQSNNKLNCTIEDFGKTMQHIEIALVNMGNKIDNNIKTTEEMNTKVNCLNDKLEISENENKIDIRTVQKGTFINWIRSNASGGVAIIVIAAIVILMANIGNISSTLGNLFK
jgi:chromosome segregation ATPase